MDVNKSNKGGNKICWRGYTYIIKHQWRKRLTWRIITGDVQKNIH